MPPKMKRYFTAYIRVNGYKRRFEIGGLVCRGGLRLAREIAQEQFEAQVDATQYPRLPKNHIPRLRDIRIVWEQANGSHKVPSYV